MLACVDVDYRGPGARAACLLFHAWTDEVAATERVVDVAQVAAYEPGAFYKRELPCLLAVLDGLGPLETIIIDGYVWLGEKAGLGAYLHRWLAVPVVGVAKTHFALATPIEVRRGRSSRPLYVTAAGLDVDDAAGHLASMHGDHRIPTLLARVDRLARS